MILKRSCHKIIIKYFVIASFYKESFFLILIYNQLKIKLIRFEIKNIITIIFSLIKYIIYSMRGNCKYKRLKVVL